MAKRFGGSPFPLAPGPGRAAALHELQLGDAPRRGVAPPATSDQQRTLEQW